MRFAILTALALSLSCATVKPIITANPNGCRDAAIQKAVASISEEVSAALVCEQDNLKSLPACVEAAAVDIAKAVGPDVLYCAIESVWTASNSGGEKAALDPLDGLRRQRAASWTAVHGPGPGGGPGTAPARAP